MKSPLTFLLRPSPVSVTDPGEQIRVQTLRILHLAGILFLAGFGLRALCEGDRGVAIADFSLLCVLGVNYYRLVYCRCVQSAAWVLLVATGGLFLYFLLSGGVEGSGPVWLFSYPVAAVLLLKRRSGLVLAVVFLVITGSILLAPPLYPGQYRYPLHYALRLQGSLLLVFTISMTYELVVGRMMAAIRIRDRRFGELFMNLPMGVYQTTADGEVARANHALAELFGYDSPATFVHDCKDKGVFRSCLQFDSIAQLLRRQDTVTGFVRSLQLPDGGELVVRENLRRVQEQLDSGEGPVRFEGTVEDVTELRRAEEIKERYRNDLLVLSSGTVRLGVAQTTGELFTIAVEQLSCMLGSALIVVCSHETGSHEMVLREYYVHHSSSDNLREMVASEPRGRVIALSGAALALYCRGELFELPPSLHDAGIGALYALAGSELEAVPEPERIYGIGIVRQDVLYGTIIIAVCTGETLSGHKREVIETLASQVAVMLQRKCDEEELRRSTEFTGKLLDTIPVPVFYKDRQGRYLGCNRAMEQFTGKTRAFLVGKNACDMAPGHIAREYARKDEELLHDGGMQSYEWVVRNGAGEDRNVIFYKGTFHDSEGNVAGLIGTFVDVTSEKQYLEATQQAKEAAEAAARFKGRLLAAVSHEMRTPLTVIIAITETLRTAAGQQECSQYTPLLNESALRLRELVDNTITTIRLDAGELVCREEPYSPAQVVRQAADQYGNGAGAGEVTVASRCGEGVPPLVTGDAETVGRILHQLMSNAVKYTEQGSITLQVTTDGDELLYTVEDTGIGMTHEEQMHVFELFFQSGATPLPGGGGAGIGLSVCSRLAVLMGGVLTVRAVPREGSCFSLRLPLRVHNDSHI